MKLNPYRRIVVGTDGSSLAEPTVARAATLAAAEDADLVLVCAYTAQPRRSEAKNVATLGGDPKFDQVPGIQAAREAMDAAIDVAEGCGARVAAAQIVDADAATALLHTASEQHADLLVVGAIRDTSIVGRLLGTVASEVVRQATCEVLIVRPAVGAPAPTRAEDAPA